MTNSEAQTEVEYMYRDPSNYKFRGSFVVNGALSSADLEPYLFDGGWFNPMDVGLPHLLTMPRKPYDHDLHEFEDFLPCSNREVFSSAQKLVDLFAKVGRNGWS